MNMGLIIALVAVLLVLVIAYNIMLQYRVKAENLKKQEFAKQNAVIEATEELIGNAHHLPYSKELLSVLNNRILYALKAMSEVDNSPALKQRIANTQQQIEKLNKLTGNEESTTFKSPSNDKQALSMLKLVKRLRDIVKSEHNKGRMDTQTFVNENARLESMQMRIHIENLTKRAKESLMRGQAGTARQLLQKGIDALASKNDAYSNGASQKLQALLAELDKRQQDKQAEQMQAIEDREKESDIDALFGGEKKKW
ncbi:DNA repair protein [Vibrio ulleungensis]|uniref:DNA repair protein n=1 Tax=Vibrio ulleungensis TaxID=2807619 RepID=A0ABS2HJD0_9VIBR|nr:DNA repair protein [Vibrio ulleungensis]MBM7036212.1 DNA repair protein [Vibrio ulleungensis]